MNIRHRLITYGIPKYAVEELENEMEVILAELLPLPRAWVLDHLFNKVLTVARLNLGGWDWGLLDSPLDQCGSDIVALIIAGSVEKYVERHYKRPHLMTYDKYSYIKKLWYDFIQWRQVNEPSQYPVTPNGEDIEV